ncbi:ABC transporter permease [Hydromonas duriensis]|uniref:Glycine betaine/proline transport system permease protein n=1 Tax=Hydromonas duriensis TaxID=1527608 RepID=A0A4R6Y4M7_9BURK|nr:proline/glycine betaine ABC transporter permease [Hydromonas duriensis]TDR27882.1 glycine betaine/proline transport system permease protein [Hydromonas duriensis]
MSFFIDISEPIKININLFLEYIVVEFGSVFDAFSSTLISMLVALEKLLVGIPPPVMILLVGALAFYASRKVGFALCMMLALYLIGALGVWPESMQTIAIMLVSVFLSVIMALPLGVLSARSDAARKVINPILDLMQTIPSFVYLIPAAMLFGLGKVPAIIATVIYAAPPLIRLTDLGIREVNRKVVEASRSFGATKAQILQRVQIPLAMPSIMQGLNQTMMMALSMVVIASMIGARGVGEIVLLGLQRNDAGQGVVGGLAIVVLAVLFDRITQAAGLRMQSHRHNPR